jgi:hypothetical protein
MRLEGCGGPWFETRCFAALLTMTPNYIAFHSTGASSR